MAPSISMTNQSGLITKKPTAAISLRSFPISICSRRCLASMITSWTDGSEYLQRLKLAHKVQIEKGKLSTTDLSQGQRKRLALLTAFLENRPIYIFDEWAADQDPYFKDFIYVNLLPDLTARHKTVFVITHDDRYYHLAERIITMDDGQVTSDTARVPLITDSENRADALQTHSSLY